jgi:type I restriction enzyme S subunit
MRYLEQLLEGIEVEWQPLADVFNLKNGYTPSKKNTEYWTSGTIPWFRMDDIRKNGRILNQALQSVTKIAIKSGKLFPANSIIISTSATIGEHALITVPFLSNQRFTCLSVKDDYDKKFDTKFLFYYCFLLAEWCENNTTVGSFAGVEMTGFKKFPIPIPPLAVQKEIVRILDTFTGLIAELKTELIARKKQFNHYRDQLLSFEGQNVEWKTLGDICSTISAGGDVPKKYSKGQITPTKEFPYPIYANATGSKGLYGYTDSYKIESDAVTISARGAKIGYHTIRAAKFTAIIRLIVLVPNETVISPKFLNYALEMTPISGTKGGIPQLTVPTVKKLSIPVPSIETQEKIVSILDKFDTLTNSKIIGLPAEIEMRQKQYEYYRDLLLTFPKPNTVV